LVIAGWEEEDEEDGGERGGEAKSADWYRVFGVCCDCEESQPRAEGSSMFATVFEVDVAKILWLWLKVVGRFEVVCECDERN
jgi:hypothetical protein